MYIKTIDKYHILRRRKRAINYLILRHLEGTERYLELSLRLSDIRSEIQQIKDLLNIKN